MNIIAFIPAKARVYVGSFLAVVGLVLLILGIAGVGGNALIYVGIGLLVIGAFFVLDGYGTWRTTRNPAAP